jgi:hypothetical protein
MIYTRVICVMLMNSLSLPRVFCVLCVCALARARRQAPSAKRDTLHSSESSQSPTRHARVGCCSMGLAEKGHAPRRGARRPGGIIKGCWWVRWAGRGGSRVIKRKVANKNLGLASSTIAVHTHPGTVCCVCQRCAHHGKIGSEPSSSASKSCEIDRLSHRGIVSIVYR